MELLEVVTPGLCGCFGSVFIHVTVCCNAAFSSMCVCTWKNVKHFTFRTAFVLCCTFSFTSILLSWHHSDSVIWLSQCLWPKQKFSYSCKSGSVWYGHLETSFTSAENKNAHNLSTFGPLIDCLYAFLPSAFDFLVFFNAYLNSKGYLIHLET